MDGGLGRGLQARWERGVGDAADGVTHRLCREQRTDDRDAERGTDLTHRRVGAAGHAARALGDLGQDHVVELGAREADAHAVEREAGHQRPHRDVGRDRHRDQQDPDRVDHEPDAYHDGRAPAPCQPTADLGAEDHEQPDGQQPESVLRRGQVLAVLEEHREHEQHTELSHGEQQSGEQAVAIGLESELTELEEGIAAAAFLAALESIEPVEHACTHAEDDRCERDRRRRGPQGGAADLERIERREPAVAAALAEPEDEQEHADGDERGARDVDRNWSVAASTRTHEQGSTDDRDGRHDHVDDERPPPRVVGGEEAAEHWAERRARAGDGAPHGERGGALAALERARDDRERCRQHQRRAEAFDDRLADDELGHRARHRREQRSRAEQSGADDEDAPVAVDIAEPSTDDQERRERERVAGDDPLQARQGGVEVAQDGGDGHVEHGVVEHHDERGDDHDGERDPAPRIGRAVVDVIDVTRLHRGCFRALIRWRVAKSIGRPGSGVASLGRRPSRMIVT